VKVFLEYGRRVGFGERIGNSIETYHVSFIVTVMGRSLQPARYVRDSHAVKRPLAIYPAACRAQKFLGKLKIYSAPVLCSLFPVAGGCESFPPFRSKEQFGCCDQTTEMFAIRHRRCFNFWPKNSLETPTCTGAKDFASILLLGTPFEIQSAACSPLVGHGASVRKVLHPMVYCVKKILDGANPGDLPGDSRPSSS
jgi:hypothetical protein